MTPRRPSIHSGGSPYGFVSRLRLLAVVLAVPVVLLLSLPGGVRAASAKDLGISLPDVTHAFGAQWRTAFAQNVSNKNITSVTKIAGANGVSAVVTDRVTGYLVAYSRVGSIGFKNGKFVTTPGPSSVLSYVNIYRSDKGPRATLTLARHYKLKKIKGVTYTIKPFSGVGDEAVAETLTFKTSAQFPTSHGITIIFRRGKYLGILSVSWFGKANTSDALRLATIMDGRFRAAG